MYIKGHAGSIKDHVDNQLVAHKMRSICGSCGIELSLITKSEFSWMFVCDIFVAIYFSYNTNTDLKYFLKQA